MTMASMVSKASMTYFDPRQDNNDGKTWAYTVLSVGKDSIYAGSTYLLSKLIR